MSAYRDGKGPVLLVAETYRLAERDPAQTTAGIQVGGRF